MASMASAALTSGPIPARGGLTTARSGDGASDDSAAIRAALDAVPETGGVVWFPAGTYVMSEVLFVHTNDTVLRGESRSASKLVFTKPLAAAYALLLAAALHEGLTGRPTFRGPADRHGLRAALAGAILLAAVWVARVLVHPEWSPDPIRPGSLASKVLR